MSQLLMEKMAMIRNTVESSNIRSIGYSPISRKMEIEFKGGSIYQYKGASANVYKNIMDAESKGKYFHKNIRYKLPYKQVLNKDGEKVKSDWKVLDNPKSKKKTDEDKS